MRVGTGRRIGRGFVWISAGISGVIYGLLCIIGILGIAALIYAAS